MNITKTSGSQVIVETGTEKIKITEGKDGTTIHIDKKDEKRDELSLKKSD